jgi:hypothetical protein
MQPVNSEEQSTRDLSPVQWVVAVHTVLLTVTILLLCGSPFNELLAALGAGLMLAQAALFSIWLVLDREPSLKRRVAILLLPVLLIMLPLVACPIAALSLPLLMTQADGLQLRRFRPETMPLPRPMQFSLSHLVRMTFVITVLFALGQFGPSRQELYASRLGELGNVLTAIGTVIVGLACGAVVLTIPVVCVWAILTPGKVVPRLALAGTGWLLGTLLLVHLIGGLQPELVVAAAIAGVSIAVLTVTLMALRGMGYRVVWETPLMKGRKESTREQPNGVEE